MFLKQAYGDYDKNILDATPAFDNARAMPGEPENQFSLTRAALNTSGAQKPTFHQYQ